jgi:hypothetical protein
MSDSGELEWHGFDEDDGPEVLTGISEACSGDRHDECPGVGEHERQRIFCVCACHRLPANA